MRILKLLFISVVLLFLAVTIISLFIPSSVRISRAVNTYKSAQDVWTYIDDMRDWQKWNPFFSGDQTRRIQYLDSSAGVPQGMKLDETIIRWQEKKADERITTMEKQGFPKIINGVKCIHHPQSDSTTIQWYMDFKLRWYPWEKFASMMFEKSYGVRMEQGLADLKKLVESNH